MFIDLLTVALASIGSIIVLFILAKLIGNKQMSQLSMFDYINGITIGSIAAEMATALETDFLKPLLAMIIYGMAAILISHISASSARAARVIGGCSVILFYRGELYKKNFSKAHLDINEFLTQCRINGYFDLSEIELAILEPNGRISFLPVSSNRPATPQDMGLSPQQSQFFITLITDGRILKDNLQQTGRDLSWLKQEIKSKGLKVKDIFLATCDRNNQLTFYEAPKNPPIANFFQ